jgi:FAD/FMN-containing dehydrogenase
MLEWKCGKALASTLEGILDWVGLTPDWRPLQGSIEGDIILPGSPAYEELPRPFNARFHHVVPRAVIRCATPEDVVETIAFIRRQGLEPAIRSGGHCFAGRSSTRGVVIDVSSMRSVSISGDVATVGAGAPSGAVYEALEERGLTIPAGTCPPVGVAGVTLGGGLGILGRKHGVTSDRLIGAQIVLADGRILEVDEHHQEDLFWALRGAGAGNFGVVTELVFDAVPAPAVTNVHLAWPFSQAAAAIEAWQAWAPEGPDELAASLKVTSTAEVERPPSVDVYVAFQGSESDTLELAEDLVVRTGSEPTSTSSAYMTFPETRRFWAELVADENDAGGRPLAAQHPYLVAKSEFFGRPFPAGAIATLTETFSRGRTSGELRELDFMPWGGAYNRARSDATAFVHRAERFQLKHAVVLDPEASSIDKEEAGRWVTGSWASVHPWGSGRVFQNFPDPDLDHWAEAYYGTNYDRLISVKARYDPDDFFHFHQSIPAR